VPSSTCSSTANCPPSCPLSKVRVERRARSKLGCCHHRATLRPTPRFLTNPTPLRHRSGGPRDQARARGRAASRREHCPRDCHGHDRRSRSRTGRRQHGKPDSGASCGLLRRCSVPASAGSPCQKTNRNANPTLPPGPLPWQIPVGRATLGRIMNVIGEPIDECGPIGTLEAHTRAFRVLSPLRFRSRSRRRARLTSPPFRFPRRHPQHPCDSPRGASLRGPEHGHGDARDRHQGASRASPEPAATDRRTRREPRSIGENARREREIFFRSFARARFRATRVARDGPPLRLSRRPSRVENSFPRHAPF
jgi:hypothetical protein